MRALVSSIAFAMLAACGGDLGGDGDPCSTSAECDDGLLCDTTQSPAVCAKMLAPRPDLAGADLAGASHDLAGADLSATPHDLSHAD